MKLNGKNVIVTGAASGVGKELTKQLLSKGCNVYGLDINEDNLKLLVDELKSDNLKTFVVDMGSSDSINKFKTEIDTVCKNIDIIINNAGIIQPFVTVDKLDDKIINKVMNINFFGPVNLIRCFLDKFKNAKNEKYIVNVSSMGGFFPFPGQTVYGASKAALKIFTEGLYAEANNSNVRVMIVLPGAMNTNITTNSNVDMKVTKEESSYKMLEANDAAAQIISGIEKNKFKLFLGSDAKFLRFLYKINSKWAIGFINNKMNKMN